MSDVTNKYVNAYIDTSVSMINEYITKYIQVQAQLKVANDIVTEREGIIMQLTAEINRMREDYAKVNEAEFIAMKNKLSHMDTLMHQMGQMKLSIKEKDEEINKALLNGKMILLLVDSLSKGDSSILKKLPLAENKKPIITPEQTKVDGVSESLVAYIKRTEGFTAKATWDNKQYTNGYGTEAKSPDEVITEAEADRRLREKLQKTQDYVSDYLTKKGYTFNRNQLDALTSFTYNLGPGGLAQLTANGSRTFDEIRQKMIEYNRSAGQISGGLKRRREEELAMFNTPSAAPGILSAGLNNTSPSQMPAQPTTGATVDSSSVDIQQAKLNMNSVPPKIVVNTNTSPSTKKKKDDTKIASDRKSTRLNSSHTDISRMPSSA